MNGMCGFLGLLADTPLDEEQRSFVDQATHSSKRLLHLITQVLDFNRSEAGTLPIEPMEFNPRELLDQAVAEHTAAAAAKGLRLVTDDAVEGERWVAPAGIIAQVLAILTDNAVKFTPHGSVTLAAERRSSGLTFSVRDTGIGLTLQELDWIQIPFAQVDGGWTRRFSGIGLGLVLASRLVRAIGGELTLTGQANEGVLASFSVKASLADPSRSFGGSVAAEPSSTR